MEAFLAVLKVFSLSLPIPSSSFQLRNILGTKNLHEILSDRESISNSMQVIHNLGARFWTLGLLRIPKKCEGGAKGDAKEVAKEVARPPSLFNLT